MRNPNYCIWTSSYDRGLEWLLQMWSKIKEQAKDAELHIFYGWNLFDYVHRNNPERQAWKKKINDMMKIDGVYHHGRVSHKELAKAFKEAGLWTYPTDFGEISCISAMKAQIYGAIPVCSDYAALSETVQFGVKVPLDDPYMTRTAGWQEQYIKEVVGLLNDHNRQKEIRKEMCEKSKELFSWEGVAQQWDKEFKS